MKNGAWTWMVAAAMLATCSSNSGGRAADSGSDGGGTDSGGTDDQCTPDEITAQKETLAELLSSELPCLTGTFSMDNLDGTEISFDTYYYDNADQLHVCGDGIDELTEMLEDAQSLAASVATDCLSDEEIDIHGGVASDVEYMQQVIVEGCGTMVHYPGIHEMTIRLDDTGEVGEITDESIEVDDGPEFVACVEAVLDGLVFPCLGGFEVCVEYFDWE